MLGRPPGACALTEAMTETVRAGRGVALTAWVKRKRVAPHLTEFVRILARTSSPAVAALSRDGTHG